MADRTHGRQTPATESTIRDWDDADPSGQTYTRVLFIDSDLTEISNAGGVFEECVFRGVRFNASSHTDAAFVNCTFVRCSFFDTTFTRCKLMGSRFDDCAYSLMKVTGGDWSFASLPGADLRGAELSGVKLREADLTGLRAGKSVLRNLDLSGASMQRADFSGCDLRGSDLSTLDPLTVELKGAIVDLPQAMVITTSLGLEVRP
ncbi:pentapeptide repeat protein [Kribbella voronezhensis]|uniref:Pentapeptide repeat protein n=1 Tax=Kribbella voronezhensis TaxID=2512212 RepID=A0A4R7TCL6_9ACTN|nr:pentapeptide repeat-containing protein [Kribbella voronezhensis]TDU89841.1 pentapeptide repeat protein [Kribbella voronezhensis]